MCLPQKWDTESYFKLVSSRSVSLSSITLATQRSFYTSLYDSLNSQREQWPPDPTKGRDNRGTPWHYTEIRYCSWWRVSHWTLLKSSSNCPLFCLVTWSTGSREDGRDDLFLPSNLSKEKNLTDPRGFFLLPFLLLFTNFGYTFNLRGKKNSDACPSSSKAGCYHEIPRLLYSLAVFWFGYFLEESGTTVRLNWTDKN